MEGQDPGPPTRKRGKKFRSPSDVKEFLGKLVNEIHQEQTEPKVGAACAQVCSYLLNAMRAEKSWQGEMTGDDTELLEEGS